MQARDIGIKTNCRLNPTFLTDLMFHEKPHSEGTLIDDGCLSHSEFLWRFKMIEFDVPGVPIEGLIVVED